MGHAADPEDVCAESRLAERDQQRRRSAMMALQFFVVLTVYPETERIALEDMDKRLAMH